MANIEQIVRQLDILRDLVACRFGMTVQELSQAYGVTRRTIERDLDDLTEAGFSLYPESGQQSTSNWDITRKPH